MTAFMSKTILRPLLIAFLVAGAFFMENLDGTVIATAVPQMARSFGVSPVDLNIGMTAYMLALAVFIPTQRLGGRSLRSAGHFWQCDRYIHRLLSSLRP